jgi:Ca-activated chloride channel family protein
MGLRLKIILGFSLVCGGLFFGSPNSASMQSGRVKPTETPSPTPRPRIITSSEIDPDLKVQKVKVTPTPTPKNDDEGDVIKVESNLVPIPVSVTDTQGRSVSNLRLEDFELQIDNKTAELADISRSQTPVRLALLFDNSSSVIDAREFEKKAAVRFFKQVIRPDKDQVALFSVSSVARLEQPLTKDVAQLVQAIEFFPKPEGATALLDGIIQAANYLKDYQGRRVIVIVSDGEDTLSDATFEDTVKTAQALNCQIYVVKTTDFENMRRSGSRIANANIRALTAERRMQDISQQTGGTVYSPIDEDELNRAFTRISAELSEQYILSYYPDNESGMRGNFRTISLTVKNHQNLTIRR